MSLLRRLSFITSLTVALILITAPPTAGGELPSSLPFCPAGMPESRAAPVALPSFADPTACRARPTRVERAATDGLPAPAPNSATLLQRNRGSYHHLGVTTAGEWAAILGRLTVRNPSVRAGSYDFVATRFMAKRVTSNGRIAWLEAGWAETGWSGRGAQRIYAFDSAGMSWLFFDDYRIGDGDRVWIYLHGASDEWRAWLWWGDRWQLLTNAPAPPAGGGALLEQYVEIHQAGGGRASGEAPRERFPAATLHERAPGAAAREPAPGVVRPEPGIRVPPIRVDQVRVRATAGGPLESWRTEQVPTVPSPIAPGYCLDWETRYDAWSAGDCPATVQE